MQLLFVMLVWMCSVKCSSAYANGFIAGVCDSMLPGHSGFGPQSTVAPYKVRVNGSSYRPGDSITVTLEAVQSGTGFQGFMLQAHRTVGGMAGGSFRSGNTGLFRLHSCFNLENSSISHATGDVKTQFEATWVAPLTASMGNVQFCATFVRGYSEFWTMVTSDPISSGNSVISQGSAFHVLCFFILTGLAVHALKI